MCQHTGSQTIPRPQECCTTEAISRSDLSLWITDKSSCQRWAFCYSEVQAMQKPVLPSVSLVPDMHCCWATLQQKDTVNCDHTISTPANKDGWWVVNFLWTTHSGAYPSICRRKQKSYTTSRTREWLNRPWVSTIVAVPRSKHPEKARTCIDMRIPNTSVRCDCATSHQKPIWLSDHADHGHNQGEIKASSLLKAWPQFQLSSTGTGTYMKVSGLDRQFTLRLLEVQLCISILGFLPLQKSSEDHSQSHQHQQQHPGSSKRPKATWQGPHSSFQVPVWQSPFSKPNKLCF